MQSIAAVKQNRSVGLKEPDRERKLLFGKFSDKLSTNPDLSRALVSYQANKQIPFYRWFKYKESFSSELVRFIIDRFHPIGRNIPRLLDPFAGAGTAITTAARSGWQATGIELLPVGVAAMRARLYANEIKPQAFDNCLNRLKKYSFESHEGSYRFPHIKITEKAFPVRTEKAISAYMDFINDIRNQDLRFLFWFACMSILEDVSYTRKDGQYLRWDSRSKRSLRSGFNKGPIADFKTAILDKLRLMRDDIRNRGENSFKQNVEIIESSCLEVLPRLQDNIYDLIVTSPPYCNRYDYSRTYALELAFIGYDEDAVKKLRQTLLSATVENKCKKNLLSARYRLLGQAKRYIDAVNVIDGQYALREVLDRLYAAKDNNELNNNNIPNMVENYFFEMNLLIGEFYRVLMPGGRVVMVNDNVRYHGEEIPVDLILSDMAESAGFRVEHIWILPRGKGNSSQQMGAFGRNELRKCVYVWSKPERET